MQRLVRLALCLCAIVTVGPTRGLAAQEAVLKPGDLAPPFTLVGSDGRTHSLVDHRDLRPVVLAWFPRAFAKE